MSRMKQRLTACIVCVVMTSMSVPFSADLVDCLTAVAAEETITEGETLNADRVVEGDLYIKNDLDLNGCSLTVKGNVFAEKGAITIGSGTMHVTGDFELRPGRTGWSEAELRMTEDSGILDVDGSVEIATLLETAAYQNAGRLRVGQDLRVWCWNSISQGYAPTGSHITEFKGDVQHTVEISANTLNYLNQVEVTGSGSLSLIGDTTGFTLMSDARFAGGSTIKGERDLLLNGNKLTVGGDFTQEGEMTVDVTGSTLEIEGNYFQGSGVLNVADGSVHIAEDYELRPGRTGWSSGELRITDDKGLLDVDGSVELASTRETAAYQNAGRLRIGKDLRVYSYNNVSQSYAPTGTHITEFKGDVEHEIEINANHLNYLDRVEVTDGGSLYLTGQTTGFTLLSDAIFADGCTVKGNRDLNLNGHTVLTEGDFRQSGDMTVNLTGGKMQINGTYWQETGVLNIGSGTLHVMDDYELRPGKTGWGSGELRITGDKGLLDVDGSAEFGTTMDASGQQDAGRLRVGKDLRVWSYNNVTQGYAPRESHITEFKGAGQHEVELYASDLNYLDQVEVTGGGSLSLIGNTSGFTLLSDARFAGGSIIKGDRPLKLNGNTVTVEGDFKQEGALTVDLTGGKMNVAGDYWQNTGTLEIGSGILNIAGNYELRPGTTGWSSGALHMTDEKGALIVGGSAELASTLDDDTQMTAGTVSISKDLRVWSYNNSTVSYPAKESHITEFRGGGEHEIAFYSAGLNHMSTVKLGVGDSITFTEHFGEIAANDKSAVTADPETIAAAEGRTVRGTAAGAGTMKLTTGGDSVEKPLVIGDSDAEGVFAFTAQEEDPLTVRLHAPALLHPGQKAEIPVTISGTIPETAWMAFVPSDDPHTVKSGLDAEGEQVKLTKITGETVTLTVPEEPGLYDIRVYDGEDPAASGEVAYQIVRVGAASTSEPAKVLLGDVNLDGVVNAKDAAALLIAAAKLGTGQPSGLNAVQASAANVNGDKSINANDAAAILRYAAALGTGKAGNITDYI